MTAMTRRLHMGCGETLQSHLPEWLKKLALVTEPKPLPVAGKQPPANRRGPFWK